MAHKSLLSAGTAPVPRSPRRPRASSKPPASSSTGTGRTPAWTSTRPRARHCPTASFESIRQNKIAIKGPITTPVGIGLPLGQRGAAQGARPVRLPAPVQDVRGRADALHENIDLVIVRENHEDLYAGIEFEMGTPERRS